MQLEHLNKMIRILWTSINGRIRRNAGGTKKIRKSEKEKWESHYTQVLKAVNHIA